MKQGDVNSTSYVENCETSAIGRAIGFLGIGATTSIASADEVLNAMAHQKAQQSQPKPSSQRRRANAQQGQRAPATGQQASPRKQTFAHIASLKIQAMENGVKEGGINSWFEAKFGKVGMNRLTDEQLQEVVEHLETIVRDSADRHLIDGNTNEHQQGRD